MRVVGSCPLSDIILIKLWRIIGVILQHRVIDSVVLLIHLVRVIENWTQELSSP